MLGGRKSTTGGFGGGGCYDSYGMTDGAAAAVAVTLVVMLVVVQVVVTIVEQIKPLVKSRPYYSNGTILCRD